MSSPWISPTWVKGFLRPIHRTLVVSSSSPAPPRLHALIYFFLFSLSPFMLCLSIHSSQPRLHIHSFSATPSFESTPFLAPQITKGPQPPIPGQRSLLSLPGDSEWSFETALSHLAPRACFFVALDPENHPLLAPRSDAPFARLRHFHTTFSHSVALFRLTCILFNCSHPTLY